MYRFNDVLENSCCFAFELLQFICTYSENRILLPNAFLFFQSLLTVLCFFSCPPQFSSCISTPSGSVFILQCAFFSFSQPFPDPAKKAILRAHVWIGMDCGVTQVLSLLMLVSCQVTSERAVRSSAMFVFFPFSTTVHL